MYMITVPIKLTSIFSCYVSVRILSEICSINLTCCFIFEVNWLSIIKVQQKSTISASHIIVAHPNSNNTHLQSSGHPNHHCECSPQCYCYTDNQLLCTLIHNNLDQQGELEHLYHQPNSVCSK